MLRLVDGGGPGIRGQLGVLELGQRIEERDRRSGKPCDVTRAWEVGHRGSNLVLQLRADGAECLPGASDLPGEPRELVRPHQDEGDKDHHDHLEWAEREHPSILPMLEVVQEGQGMPMRLIGQTRKMTCPMMLVCGTGPQSRLSQLSVRLSPITKYEFAGIFCVAMG